jgi:hypothetical protein
MTGKYDAQGRFVVAESVPSLNLTSQTIQPEILLFDTTLGASGAFDFDLTTVTNGTACDHLRIVCSLRATPAGTTDNVYMFFNNDTTVTNYYRQRLVANTTTIVGELANTPIIGNSTAAGATADNFAFIEIKIPYYRSVLSEKISYGLSTIYSTNADTRINQFGHKWNTAKASSAIARIQIRTDNHPTDLFTADSRVMVYGQIALSVLTNVTIS